MTVYKNVNIKKSDVNKQYRVVVLKELQELMSEQKMYFLRHLNLLIAPKLNFIINSIRFLLYINR